MVSIMPGMEMERRSALNKKRVGFGIAEFGPDGLLDIVHVRLYVIEQPGREHTVMLGIIKCRRQC